MAKVRVGIVLLLSCIVHSTLSQDSSTEAATSPGDTTVSVSVSDSVQSTESVTPSGQSTESVTTSGQTTEAGTSSGETTVSGATSSDASGGSTTAAAATPPNCAVVQIYQLLANVADVSTYYVCFNPFGQPVLEVCPDGLVFSEDTLSCAFPSSTSTTSANSQKCFNPGQSVALNDPKCMKWATCTLTNGLLVLVDQTCADGEVFNPSLGKCVTDGYVCGEMPDCNSGDLNGQSFIDIHDCKSFYSCYDGIRILNECPAGYQFEPLSQICIPESMSVCVPAGGQNKVKDICKGSPQKFLSDPGYCRGYYYCIDEHRPYWSYCNNKQYFFDGYCTDKKPPTCVCEDAVYPEGQDTVLAENPDKTKFYVCSKNAAPVVKSCPDGYEFNKTELSCMK